MTGFSAEEFEPDPEAMPEDDDDDASGAAPGPGHNRRGKPRNTPRLPRRCSG